MNALHFWSERGLFGKQNGKTHFPTFGGDEVFCVLIVSAYEGAFFFWIDTRHRMLRMQDTPTFSFMRLSTESR